MITSDKSLGIVYCGKPLVRSTCYKWTLTVWDNNGNSFAAAASFETGLFGSSGFDGAEWISPCDTAAENALGLPAFRKSIFLNKQLVSARLYSCALGVYENYINGERVGVVLPDGSGIQYHELKPGYSEIDKRKHYNTYDVTAMLHTGENVLSALTGSGWWSGLIADNYGKKLAYLRKLLVTYTDGTSEVFITDDSWKAAYKSPMFKADIYNGKSYDAETDRGWMKPGFVDCGWNTVTINREFNGEISAWRGSFITVRNDLERKA